MKRRKPATTSPPYSFGKVARDDSDDSWGLAIFQLSAIFHILHFPSSKQAAKYVHETDAFVNYDSSVRYRAGVASRK